MILIGVCRIGNDPVIRFTQDGKPLLELSLAYHYGRKGQDGNYATQWIKAVLWGDRAEKIVGFLSKGAQIYVELNDVHLNQYKNKDGSDAANIKANIRDIQMLGAAKRQEPQHESAPAQSSGSIADIDDDLPF